MLNIKRYVHIPKRYICQIFYELARTYKYIETIF